MKHAKFFASAALLLASWAVAKSACAQPPYQPKSFPVAQIRFEQNATDGDVEVVFEVSGRGEGLTKLAVEAPDGRRVVDFASDESGAAVSGIRQFVFESPEPKDVAGLKAAFPEGVYNFEGETESGLKLRGKAALSHKLPATTSFVIPKANAPDVPASDLTISWAPVSQVTAYIVELEQEDLNTSITARLPASAKSFAVPNGFLRPGAEYQLGIGTVGQDGNVSYVETHFSTADK